MFGDEAIKMLYGNTHLEKEKLNETKRHNKVIQEESIAKGKKVRHHYTMQILGDFNELKEKGMTVDDIIAIFPDMEKFDDR